MVDAVSNSDDMAGEGAGEGLSSEDAAMAAMQAISLMIGNNMAMSIADPNGEKDMSDASPIPG